MCISSRASIFTFLFSIISSIILIFYGNKKYKKENLITGIIIIYVAFMQIFEYFMWIDINNKKGYNKIASQFGAFFNYTQPLFLYVINYIVSKKNNLILSLINFIYFIYFSIRYSAFLNSNEVITHVLNGHLKWNWEKYFNVYYYCAILIINLIFTYTNIPYLIMMMLFIFVTLFFSYYKYYEHTGEIWCYIMANVPLLMCIITYFI